MKFTDLEMLKRSWYRYGMADKRLKRPRDPMQLAKLIGDIATGQVKDEEKPKTEKPSPKQRRGMAKKER